MGIHFDKLDADDDINEWQTSSEDRRQRTIHRRNSTNDESARRLPRLLRDAGCIRIPASCIVDAVLGKCVTLHEYCSTFDTARYYMHRSISKSQYWYRSNPMLKRDVILNATYFNYKMMRGYNKTCFPPWSISDPLKATVQQLRNIWT